MVSLKSLIGGLRMIVKYMLYKFFQFIPLRKKSILAFSYYGGNNSGSPKYIMEYIAKYKNEYDLIWASLQPIKNSKIKVIKYNSIKYYYYLATSKIIITNYRMTKEFKKRNGQIYIQTWHSSLRLKKIEKDAESSLSTNYIEMAKVDSEQIDRLIVGSRKSKDIFKKAFWYKGEYLEVGTPQCDIFFDDNFKDKEEILNKIKIKENKKILLYAPTFRNNKNLDVYHLDFNSIKKALECKFGGEWMIIIKLHPHLINEKIKELPKFVIDATNYEDTQELLFISDVLITDYSAIMFDYLYTKRPCFLHMIDYNDYVKNERGLYFNLEELPYLISKNNTQLISNIEQYDDKKYIQRRNTFLSNIGSFENGTACDGVLNYIQEVMKDD